VKEFSIWMLHKTINRLISGHFKFQMGCPFLGYKA
jgi:hypothetical protein